jgi:hypothetical protein
LSLQTLSLADDNYTTSETTLFAETKNDHELAESETSITDYKLLPRPLQIMKQYIQWHSHESLLRAQQQQNRIFVIASYSCPNRAGNFITSFLNSLIWAIITNRTLLYTFEGPFLACLEINQQTSMCQANNHSLHSNCTHQCHFYNTQQDCDRVLQQATWLPSWEMWSRHQFLQNSTLYEVDFWSTVPKDLPWFALPPQEQGRRRQDHHHRDVGVDARTDLTLVQFPLLVSQTDYLARAEHRDYLLNTTWSRQIAEGLHSGGRSYLYGMLYRHAFRPTPAVTRTLPLVYNDTIFGLGLHSRHIYESMDGGRTKREEDCLLHLYHTLYNKTRFPGGCQVHLMSDRQLTLDTLSRFIQTNMPNCQPVLAQHTTSSASERREHGPFAGAAFFHDMELLARGTRHGFVGTSTTSTDFVLSAIVYDHGHNNTLALCRFTRRLPQSGARTKKKRRNRNVSAS